MLEKSKYDRLMAIDEDVHKLYCVFDPKGMYIFWLNGIDIPVLDKLNCPDTTLWTKQKKDKEVYLLEESQASYINNESGFDRCYKKLDAIKEFECDHNITIILELLNKWNKKANSNKELKTVIESFLDIQWHIIELKRDRDLALKAVIQYKMQRDAALDEKHKAIKQLKLYEDKNFN